MYTQFYQLRKPPFHVTPDPSFFFLSDSHKEALASIIYGIEQRKGFIAIFGEVGLGKTTVLRSYLDRIDRGQIKPVYVFNANVTFAGLLKTVCRELGVRVRSAVVSEMVSALHEALIKEYRQGRNVVLIIDEAQNMPTGTLENLRMLSNLETSTDKLIQIVLVGQPEFQNRLEQHELRQLKQRLAIRHTITPLSSQESMDYIVHRLSKVTIGSHRVFTRKALLALVKAAKGIPRVINILCDNALIAGYASDQRPVNTLVVKEVITDFLGTGRRHWFRWVLGGVGLTALAIFIFTMTPLRRLVPYQVNGFERIRSVLTRSPQQVDQGSPPIEQTEPAPVSRSPEFKAPVVFDGGPQGNGPEKAETTADRHQASLALPGGSPVLAEGSPHGRIVQKGESLEELLVEEYGSKNQKLRE